MRKGESRKEKAKRKKEKSKKLTDESWTLNPQKRKKKKAWSRKGKTQSTNLQMIKSTN